MTRALLLLVVACGGGSGDPGVDPVDAAPTTDAAPPGCLAWPGDRQWGTAGDDHAGVAIAPGGDLVLFGYEGGSLDGNVAPVGDATGYLTRLDAAGAVRWRHDLATAGTDVIDAVELRPDGSALIAGRIRPGAGQFDLAVAELGADGDRRWLHGAGVAPSERPMAIASDGDLHVVAGYHDAYIPTNHVEAWEDPFVFAWRDGGGPEAGALIAFGSAEPDTAHGVAVDAAAGQVWLATTAQGGPLRGGYVARVDLAGGERTTTPIAGGLLETTVAIRRLADGDLVVAGSTWRALGDQPRGDEDVYVARFDPTLTTRRWITQVGGPGSDVATDLAVAADGRLWVVGETLGSVDPARPNRGQADVFVVALDAGGAERWVWQAGSAGDDRATHIAVDACETVLVAGRSDGALVAGATPQRFDAFVLRATR